MEQKSVFEWVLVETKEEYDEAQRYLSEHRQRIENLIVLNPDPFPKTSKKSDKLTKREIEVLKFLMEYKTNAQIAEELFVSINTVKKHVGNIIRKLKVYDRICAAAKAERTNILETNISE